jgi:hypothetical protein
MRQRVLNIEILVAVMIISLFSAYALAEDTICARVKIEIRQELTLERQAFDAHMRITNGLTHVSLQDVDIDISFADEDGNPVLVTTDPDNETALFFIRLDSMGGVDDIDGAGVVAADSVADINWLIIPAQGASNGLEQGTLYYVGAKLTYTIGGEEYVTEVSPDYIFVKPMPDLTLDYFLPNDVYGDDPFTSEIEPAIPFSLGVRVLNSGQGTAKSLKIDSAQPKIVENEQGLLINFQIEGSEVNGAPETPSLLVDFGDIDPNTAGTARWMMTCSLYGRFVEFTAEFSHSDELGGELTSLITAVNTHFLVRNVMVDLPGRDYIRDYLAKDGDVYKVYESNAVDSDVTDQSLSATMVMSGTSGTESRYTLTVPPTAGLMVVKLDDPLDGTKMIKAAYRSDGKQISLDNVWLSKTRQGNDPWQPYFHLFDVNTPGTYTIIFEDSAVFPQAPVLQYIPDRQRVEGVPLSFLVEASDPNGTIPVLSASPLPVGAVFVDHGDGTGDFDWTPAVGQAGTYHISFVASDGLLEHVRTPIISICTADDSDCDGMNDQWELDNFGSLDRDGTGDYDGDGISDLDEFLNGTDPADSLVVYLSKGYNLITIPDVLEGENLKGRIADLGDSLAIEKIMVFDKLNDVFVAMIPDDPDNPDYNLESGDALVVYALQDQEIFFESRLCEPFDLQVGQNLVGMTCAPYGYTARQFLETLGADKVVSIQRYNVDDGKFETVGFTEDAVIQGADFNIIPGEGYFVTMKTAFNDFSF